MPTSSTNAETLCRPHGSRLPAPGYQLSAIGHRPCPAINRLRLTRPSYRSPPHTVLFDVQSVFRKALLNSVFAALPQQAQHHAAIPQSIWQETTPGQWRPPAFNGELGIVDGNNSSERCGDGISKGGLCQFQSIIVAKHQKKGRVNRVQTERYVWHPPCLARESCPRGTAASESF